MFKKINLSEITRKLPKHEYRLLEKPRVVKCQEYVGGVENPFVDRSGWTVLVYITDETCHPKDCCPETLWREFEDWDTAHWYVAFLIEGQDK